MFKEILDTLTAVGTFCSAIGTIGLAYLSYQALASFNRWKTERIFEKKSVFAEEALVLLEYYDLCINQWLIDANSWCIFNRNDQAIKNKFHQLSEEKKDELNKAWNQDPYEVRNFCNRFQNDFKTFIEAKKIAFRLNEEVIYKQFIDLEIVLKPLSSQMTRLYQPQYPLKAKTYIEQKFLTAPTSLTSLLEELKEQLRNKIHYQ